MNNNPKPRVWITYAWVDNEEGDFTYLVQELNTYGVDAKYDKIAIIPGRDLQGNPGDVDENNHFTSLGKCGRRFLCLGKRD